MENVEADAHRRAEQFLNEEKEFHLGALPTEQSHPKTRSLSATAQSNLPAAVGMLLEVDDDVVQMARRRMREAAFDALRKKWVAAARDGRRVFLSGCGATGRLCILLEAMWRDHWRTAGSGGNFADRVVSVMTGGDRALIRSVEGFEDYTSIGRRQMVESGVGKGDIVVAVTEGGETSSVIGTAWEGLERGADVFFVFNNPADILCRHVKRSREIIQHPEVTVLDLSTGPMAVAGSTRMQAVTAELLVIGAAMELAIRDLQGMPLQSDPAEYFPAVFAQLLLCLRNERNRESIAQVAAMEENVYRRQGLVTYLMDEFLLDLLTDTTERAPTFSLPPFRPVGQSDSPQSWAFVNNPLYSTSETWPRVLGRSPRCLNWDAQTYRDLGTAQSIWNNPPALGSEELLRFAIGHDVDPERLSRQDCALVVVQVGPDTPAIERLRRFARAQSRQNVKLLGIRLGPSGADEPDGIPFVQIICDCPDSPVRLWQHLVLKLTLNTLSTVTMARLGRIAGNWMAYAETTNKKLIDRGTRLVAELTGLPYARACLELHRTLEELRARRADERSMLPPAVITIERLKKGTDGCRGGKEAPP